MTSDPLVVRLSDSVTIIRGDCLDILPTLGKVDAVVTDPPYGSTACKWDAVIPVAEMWKAVGFVLGETTPVVLFAMQPFTSVLVSSNLAMFKYSWVWDKKLAANFLAAKRMPLLRTEDVLVFSRGGANNGARRPMPYYPQMVPREKARRGVLNRPGNAKNPKYEHLKNDNHPECTVTWDSRYPTNLLEISNASHQKDESKHPTQKPVSLMEYLIRTYTKEGEIVLDFTMGSGTTGIACIRTGRKFIGIEKDAGHFATARARLENELRQGLLPLVHHTNPQP